MRYSDASFNGCSETYGQSCSLITVTISDQLSQKLTVSVSILSDLHPNYRLICMHDMSKYPRHSRTFHMPLVTEQLKAFTLTVQNSFKRKLEPAGDRIVKKFCYGTLDSELYMAKACVRLRIRRCSQRM